MLNIKVDKHRVQCGIEGKLDIIIAETVLAVRFVFDAIKEAGGEAEAKFFLSTLADLLLDDIFTQSEIDGEPVCQESED